jgi:hypothetical protein
MANDNPQPIGTYREVSPYGKREFLLFENKLSIQGSNRGDDYLHYVPLEQMSPDFGTHTQTKSNLFFLFLIVLNLFVSFVVLIVQRISPKPGFADVLIFLVGLLVVCLIGAALTRRTCLFYTFVNVLGVKIFDIAEAGPEKANCKAFAELVSQTIKNLRGL